MDEISIKAYDTGVAILQFSLENYKYPCSDDVLKINDFGRRIYPQFLGKGEKGIDAAKNKFYADRISIEADSDSSGKSRHSDDSGYYDHPFNIDLSDDQDPIQLREFISKLLGNRFKNRYGKGKKRLKKGDVFINPVIDDRMFVICWYGNKRFAPELKNNACTAQEKQSYTENDFWYKFLFVDGEDKGCASKIMEKELLEKHTYIRWIKYGTLYGISRYSFMMLTNNRNDFVRQHLLPHIQTMYYQIVILALAQRASILRFSDEVAYVSRLKDKGSDKISILYENYIKLRKETEFNEQSYIEKRRAEKNMGKIFKRMHDEVKEQNKKRRT